MRSTTAMLMLGLALLGATYGVAHGGGPQPTRAEGGGARTQPAVQPDSLTPEERMNRRFPQKVRVGDLIGLPMLDHDDRTLGHVKDVVRTPDGKIVLIMPFGGWFSCSGRPVGVPIETVAILARHLNVLDIPREDFPALATWKDSEGTPIAPDETIRIAISRR